jgi:hypothetical protein
MKLSDIKPLAEAAPALAILEQRPEFQRLRQVVGDKLANDVLLAWSGDMRDYERTGGKNFQSLVVQMLNDNVLQRKYNIPATKEVRDVVVPIIQLAHHAMPDVSRMRAPQNAPRSNDVWGNVKWARESMEFTDYVLYESLKRDVRTLLTS